MDVQCSTAGSGRGAGNTHALLACCKCKSQLLDLVLLDCLHSCCRPCLVESSSETATEGLSCPVCFNVTAMAPGSTNNDFIETCRKRSTLLIGSSQCKTCADDGRQDAAAEFWCLQCWSRLCVYCLGWHNKVTSGHTTARLNDVQSWPMSRLIPTRHCAIHKRPIAVQCFDCRLPKCLLCADLCLAAKHDTQVIDDKRVESYWQMVTRVTDGAHKNLGVVFSKLLGKIKRCLIGLQEHRNVGLVALVQHKGSLVAAIDQGLDKSVGTVQAAVDSSSAKSSRTIEVTRKLSKNLAVALDYYDFCRRSAEARCFLLQKRRLELRLYRHLAWTDNVTTVLDMRIKDDALAMRSTLPLTADVAAAVWIGQTYCKTAQQAPLLFKSPDAASSRTFRLPFRCADVAVTHDGLLLLAARKHGLREYNDNGRELSSWTPPRRSNGKLDKIYTVKETTDGCAAVSLHCARLIVLLRRCAGNEGWQMDRRITALQSSPWSFYVHRDLITVTEGRRDDLFGTMPSPRLQLLKLSNGQLLYKQTRQYDITNLALTSSVIVTASSGTVRLSSGQERRVVCGHSHPGDMLWQYELNCQVSVNGICTAPTGTTIYIAVKGITDRSKDRVRAISGQDGKKLKDVIRSNSHGLRMPVWLSLATGRRTVLAVLSAEEVFKPPRVVTIYPAASNSGS